MMSVIVSALILWIPPASASYEHILDVAEEYQSQKKTVNNLETEKRQALGRLYKIERETELIVREKSRLKSDEIVLKKDLKNVSTSIVDLETKVKATARLLYERMEAAEKLKELPWLYIFLSAESPVDLERSQYLLDTINKKELGLATEYLENIASLKAQKEKLTTIASQLIDIKKELQSKESILKNQHENKKSIVSSLDKKIETKKKSMQKIQNLGLRLSSSKENSDFQLLFATTFFDKKGSLPHPAEGPILHDYSFNNVFANSFVQLMHKGLFYKLDPGSKVKAIAPGRISFFDKVKNLGWVAIVDHGSNYYSVYANLRKKIGKISSIVEAGDEIGESGSGNPQFQSGLYFEIRHFAEPENPKDWLDKQKNFDQLAKDSATREGES